ncbi:hypothetical protein EG329_013816 [Mollisiaceae sp. DMI_Dod_QoI]|nr:hypothetical protein EG329_013816 [Helotiales sp. DMI_Dod_QoI]
MGQSLSRLPFIGQAPLPATITSSTTHASDDTTRHLLSTMRDLQADVKKLQESNQSLHNELSTAIRLKTKVHQDRRFTLFSKLPTEVRCIIWRAALEEPRIVGSQFASKDRHSTEEILAATTPTHPILNINRESRKVALKCLVRLNLDSDKAPALYINPKIDTLWLSNYNYHTDDLFTDSFWEGAPQLRSIAVPFKAWLWIVQSSGEYLLDYVRAFFHKGVEEVVLITDEERSIIDSELILIDPRRRDLFYREDDCSDVQWLFDEGEEAVSWNTIGERVSKPLHEALSELLYRKEIDIGQSS